MKDKNPSPVNLDITNLFKLFFKYPIAFLPVIEDHSIYSFVSKEKILRLSNTSQTLNTDLTKNWNKILSEPSISEFFIELDAISISHIPIINKKEMRVDFISVATFNAMYREVSTLSNENFLNILEHFETPIAILNSSIEVLYKNKSFVANYKHLLKKDTLKKNISREMLLSQIDKKSIKIKIEVEGMEYDFHLETFIVQKSTVFLLRS